nr:cytochrome c oxidase subunit 3 [Trinoton querquedulae]
MKVVKPFSKSLLACSFHVVKESLWPLVISMSVCGIMTNLLAWTATKHMSLLMSFPVTLLICSVFGWLRDVSRENLMGNHPSSIQKGVKFGMLLMISSEIMFFISFFWVIMAICTTPSLNIWTCPPKGVEPASLTNLVLFSTFVLITSSVTVTWSHKALLLNDKKESLISMTITLLLGWMFVGLQLKEYSEMSFTISDGVYGSVFYMLTGFHGTHVLIGTIMLFVSVVRMHKNVTTYHHHVSFEITAWYWHFVDVVWLFVITIVYFWPSL